MKKLKMGLAIGKGGAHIKSLQNKIDRNVELVEYNEDPIKLLKNKGFRILDVLNDLSGIPRCIVTKKIFI